jgi:antirestriction protein ArdC
MTKMTQEDIMKIMELDERALQEHAANPVRALQHQQEIHQKEMEEMQEKIEEMKLVLRFQVDEIAGLTTSLNQQKLNMTWEQIQSERALQEHAANPVRALQHQQEIHQKEMEEMQEELEEMKLILRFQVDEIAGLTTSLQKLNMTWEQMQRAHE